MLEQGNAEKTGLSAMRVSGPHGGAICFLPVERIGGQEIPALCALRHGKEVTFYQTTEEIPVAGDGRAVCVYRPVDIG